MDHYRVYHLLCELLPHICHWALMYIFSIINVPAAPEPPRVGSTDQGPAYSYQKPAFSTFSPNNTYRRMDDPSNANNHNSSTLRKKNSNAAPIGKCDRSGDPNVVDIKLRTIGASGTLDSSHSASTTSGSYVVDPQELCEEIDELFFHKNKTLASPMRCWIVVKFTFYHSRLYVLHEWKSEVWECWNPKCFYCEKLRWHVYKMF